MKISHTPYDDPFLNGKTGLLQISDENFKKNEFLIAARDYNFLSVSVDIEAITLLNDLQDLNFRVVDYSVKPKLNFDIVDKAFWGQVPFPKILNVKIDKFADDSVVKILSENYSNQRFLRDPKISKKTAIERYAAWSRDLNQNRSYFKCIKNNEIIGCMLVETGGELAKLLLTAMQPQVQRKGYGKL